MTGLLFDPQRRLGTLRKTGRDLVANESMRRHMGYERALQSRAAQLGGGHRHSCWNSYVDTD